MSSRTMYSYPLSIETDSPDSGSMLDTLFALVYAGSFDGQQFITPQAYTESFYREHDTISGILSARGAGRKWS